MGAKMAPAAIMTRRVTERLPANPDIANGRQIRPMPHTIGYIVGDMRRAPIMPVIDIDPLTICRQIRNPKRGLANEHGRRNSPR